MGVHGRLLERYNRIFHMGAAQRSGYDGRTLTDLTHRLLQEKFEKLLRGTLNLSDEHFESVVSRGWGLAGIKEDDTITTTKIPKSGFLVQYLDESDPLKKREYYCHCPRIRDAVGHGETLPLIHCYCGAGFYKGKRVVLFMPCKRPASTKLAMISR